MPPQEAVGILDIPPPPEASVSPDGRWMVVTYLNAMPTMKDRVASIASLGGVRVNVRTNGPYDTPQYDLYSSYTGTGTGYQLIDLQQGSKRDLAVPDDKLGPPIWSPDSSRFAFLHVAGNGVALWVVDVTGGEPRALTDPVINAARSIDSESDRPCSWLAGDARLLCHFVPSSRGAVPERGVPKGPAILQAHGEQVPVGTFTDLLTDEYDAQLYDYYMASQPMVIDAESGTATPLGKPGVYQQLTPSDDGEYFLSIRIVRPYSYLVPASRFPKEVKVLNAQGQVVKHVASLPASSGGLKVQGWAPAQGRGFAWIPGRPAALVYVEALDGGDPKKEIEFRDSVRILDAPFGGNPRELMRTKSRIVNSVVIVSGKPQANDLFKFTEDGATALIREIAWSTMESKVWLLDLRKGVGASLLWEHNHFDRYRDPGVPLTRINAQAKEILRQAGDWIYLAGEGGSADGDHPFLDRYNLSTGKTERLLATPGKNYERVVDALDDGATRVVTRYETSVDYPNFYLRDLKSGSRMALTGLTQAPSALARAIKQQIHYVRNDGVPLSGTLYLPPDYKKGRRLPALVWGYPREYEGKQGTDQVRGSSYKYSGMSSDSVSDYRLFLTQGYAVLEYPAMPIIAGSETRGDTDVYTPQLIASAQAAVDKLVEMGVADRHRIGIAGISHGAWMTLYLLARSDMFAAGIAMNGAYNRTLSPFGFQGERRKLWEAPKVYMERSPLVYAPLIKKPALILHGEIDSNPGTSPIQSQRMYDALQSVGATARLVMSPYEEHIYVARETRLHVLAEMFDWFDKYVKNAKKKN